MDTFSNVSPIELSDLDVIAAMKELQGYIDITPNDFREIFQLAWHHALRRIQQSVRAKNIMSAPVLCIPAEMELVAAARQLADHRFSGAPVVDTEGMLVGVISEKDFLARMGMQGHSSFLDVIAHCLEDRGCMVAVLRNKSVQEIMSAPPLAAGAEITAGEISTLFTEKKINRLPIVDGDNRPVGIVTRGNLVQSYCFFNER